jgi:glycogen operon protein
MSEPFAVEPGHRFPTGASVQASGVNFSMFSRNATRAWLRLYRDALTAEPLFEVELDPHVNRTFFFWHVFVTGAYAGLHYTWRVDGPQKPRLGFRFDARNELLDPWARIVAPQRWDRKAARRGERSAIRAVVAERDCYDWEEDEVLERPLEDAVIYELHVGGFTRHASSGAIAPGTFKALIDKIPYLQSLGVTDV